MDELAPAPQGTVQNMTTSCHLFTGLVVENVLEVAKSISIKAAAGVPPILMNLNF